MSGVSAIVARHAFGTAGNKQTYASSMRRLRMSACLQPFFTYIIILNSLSVKEL
jgi:hypothetical protein